MAELSLEILKWLNSLNNNDAFNFFMIDTFPVSPETFKQSKLNHSIISLELQVENYLY